MSTNGKIYVLDANDGPCVRSLLTTLAGLGWETCFFRPYSFAFYKNVLREPISNTFKWKETERNIREIFLLVPGFSKFPGISEKIVQRTVMSATRRFGKPDIVIYTMPQYARLAKRLSSNKSVYFAYDAYRFYKNWNKERVEHHEASLLQTVDAVAVISRQIEDDWKGKTRGPIQYLPNAAADTFLSGSNAVCGKMKNMQHPVVGCIGNLNEDYDWELVENVALSLPEVSFVFVGRTNSFSEQMNKAATLNNVHFIGWIEREELADCLSKFDVCWSPLILNDFNHRRCPLRLYDYLTTKKPVLSTALREACELKDYIEIIKDYEDCVKTLERMLAGEYTVDVERRREFMQNQTWAVRAKTLEDFLLSLLKAEES